MNAVFEVLINPFSWLAMVYMAIAIYKWIKPKPKTSAYYPLSEAVGNPISVLGKGDCYSWEPQDIYHWNAIK